MVRAVFKKCNQSYFQALKNLSSFLQYSHRISLFRRITVLKKRLTCDENCCFDSLKLFLCESVISIGSDFELKTPEDTSACWKTLSKTSALVTQRLSESKGFEPQRLKNINILSDFS